MKSKRGMRYGAELKEKMLEFLKTKPKGAIQADVARYCKVNSETVKVRLLELALEGKVERVVVGVRDWDKRSIVIWRLKTGGDS